jgi:hypothetical protein
MPTVLKRDRYRFFFYSGDRGEPPHIHVEQEDRIAKFWLSPVRLASSGGFRRREISEVERIVLDERERFLEAWNDFFGS